MYKKVLASVLALLFVFSSLLLSSCNENNGEESGNSANSETSGNETSGSGYEDAKVYTLNEYIESNPQNWNPHTWETNGDSYISTYAEMGFVDSIFDTEGSYKWNFEMADNIEDVTAKSTDYNVNLADWGIDASETGRVWLFTLNQNAKWADGTVINADTYVYSMKALLDPAMKNYRANNFYSGSSSMLGAYAYFYAGDTVMNENVDSTGAAKYAYDTWVKGDDGQYAGADGTKLYFSLKGALTYQLQGKTLGDYSSYFTDIYNELLALADEDGYVPVTDDTIAKLYSFTGSDTWGNEAQSDLVYYTVYPYTYGDADWSKVGLIKVSDYSFLYITEFTITQFYMNTAMTSNWIVYQNLYENNKSTTAGLTTTTYGSAVDKYMSFGPYKLSSFEKDKQLVFERNDNWYGYTDGKHEGQYQTDKIVCEVISDHNTQLELFESGSLDTVDLTSDDMDTYSFAENLLKTDLTYTYKFFFATDKTVLQTLSANASSDSKTVNKVILYYDKFREAFSFAIDRADYALKGTAGQKPALALINSLYYYDVENDPSSVYRNTDEAKQVIVDLYGVEYGEGKSYATLDAAYSAITGYDLEKAKALFAEVYDEAKTAGDLTDTDVFEFTCSVGSNETLTEEQSLRNTLIQGYIDAATVGTPFEGKIKITFTTSPKRYNDVMDGINEMAMGAWGGAAFYPFSLIRCYTDPDYADIHEGCGFDPKTETVIINIDGTDITKTYKDWAASIQPGGDYYNAEGNYSTMLKILAALEYNILKGYHLIILTSDATVSAYSNKITYITTKYNIMYAYGGVRFMTYNYDDAAWDAYIKTADCEIYS